MCPVCSELHSSVEGFRKHYKLSHSPGQQFICSHCDKCFMDNFKLQEHVRVHTGEAMVLYILVVVDALEFTFGETYLMHS